MCCHLILSIYHIVLADKLSMYYLNVLLYYFIVENSNCRLFVGLISSGRVVSACNTHVNPRRLKICHRWSHYHPSELSEKKIHMLVCFLHIFMKIRGQVGFPQFLDLETYWTEECVTSWMWIRSILLNWVSPHPHTSVPVSSFSHIL